MAGAPSSGPVFDDGKAPDAMRTIGEVASALNIKPHVLRYWEQQFPMLRPLKRSGGRRLYRPDDVALVATIDRLVNREGYTLKGAKRALSQGAVAETETVSAAEAGSSDAREAQSVTVVPQLRAIRDRLAAALNA
ncbi:MerR family transcriptional regulator [Aurantiacibacter gangjinensis]|uniref:Uncharacterized protein n=1 Tax=Aurantiacibacter gangjinensis TaxID=502682 RepID=A0A0G9MR56_9SPHN|nr:MerR family transcriptional regulator [Aurantiacibacter gangjinensis]APE29105.1 Transcriptional regulator, MerR family [Aurantiacibacter gangjinensis]KLE33192.1 hypothetical protein AAW01_04265 [Aurantiacibacter gangjinensis]